ncbi:hypothetical protein DPMN_131516 [Dreissena polymorpha]|uniref:Reverse transcriptase n=1 Tax=Dreissena polymorpha TaxID=45954 RepID=A0A9D4JYJ3_DREPO|nr:hypothetical protein DPMN_131516 [Dreissena polymorpha]
MLVAESLTRLGFTINIKKSKVFKTNASNKIPITVQSDALEEVEKLNFLGSIKDNHEGTNANVSSRMHQHQDQAHQNYRVGNIPL